MLKDYLNQDRSGFAITLEIMLSMLLASMMLSITFFFAQAMEIEKFFADVASSTCVVASRYGGNDSKAYRIQVGNNANSIEDNVNLDLSEVVSTFKGVTVIPVNGKYITVSNYPDADNNISVSMRYQFGTGSPTAGLFDNGIVFGVTTRNFTVPSLMQAGRLVQ